ncbi:MAG: hypothetical protein OHK0052_07630 [Anaerolineales bacterium]
MARTPKPSGKKLPDKGKAQGRAAVEHRPERKRFLIVCEGEQTEPNYFKAFRVNAVVEVVGAGMVTTSLVAEAERLANQADNNNRYDQVWVVFDKDSCSNQDFNRAIEDAHKLGFFVAYSNEAFELWYVLHFNYMDSALHRSQYIEILTQHLWRTYQKNDPLLYETLLARQETALRNAKKLLETYQPHNPATDNPCTTVHLLVDELNRHSR